MSHDEHGATTVEYGLIVAAVGVAFVLLGPTLADAVTELLDVVLEHVLGAPPERP